MKRFLLPALSLALLLGCAPKACETCKGTGKITTSNTVKLPYEVINESMVNTGVMNPDYTWDFTIRNNGDKAGTFTITCNYVYAGIGEKNVTGELFVPAHETAKTAIRYDADKVADKFSYSVQAPEVIVTNETICPTCNGKGVK